MLNPIFVNYMLGISPGVEGSSKDLLELFVETTDAKLLKVKVLFKDLFFLHLV